MIINNVSTRLHLSGRPVASRREAERQRIKAATQALRTHAEKIAWHLAEMAAAKAAPVPVPVAVKAKSPRR